MKMTDQEKINLLKIKKDHIMKNNKNDENYEDQLKDIEEKIKNIEYRSDFIMKKLNKEINEREMIEYLDKLIEKAIYCHGVNSKMIASYLVSNGCRVYMGSRRRKYLKSLNNE